MPQVKLTGPSMEDRVNARLQNSGLAEERSRINRSSAATAPTELSRTCTIQPITPQTRTIVAAMAMKDGGSK